MFATQVKMNAITAHQKNAANTAASCTSYGYDAEITLTKVLASFQSFTEYLASVGYDVYRAREPDFMTRLFEFIVNFFW
jgi:hypothetical protein